MGYDTFGPTLRTMIEDIAERTEGDLTSEYARGQLELTADMYAIPGVETGIRVDQIRALVDEARYEQILALRNQEDERERRKTKVVAEEKLIDAANTLIDCDVTMDEITGLLKSEFGEGY